ncbi:interleukin-17 receptor A [Chanodichthys erythropterus]|uniref:interleukin-17 receptor A n=1 Tax=Chanodichthys erythropterus TaxID=933992 RepID=UPI00351EF05A
MSVIFLFLFILSHVIMKISPLHLIELPPMECSQEGVACNVQVGNCSDEGWVKPWTEVPGSSREVTANVKAKRDDSGQFAPVIHLSWSQLPDSSIYVLKGTEVRVVEMATNQSICVRYIFLNKLRLALWTFSLDRIVVVPNFKYQVFVTNLPKPERGINTVITNITVPESIWDKKVKWSVRNYKKKNLVITIEFEPLEFSDQHRVSICSPDLHPEPSRIVIKDNETYLKVNFTLEAWWITQCSLDLVIQPLSIQSMKNCLDYREKVNICPCTYYTVTLNVFLPDAPVHFIILVILGVLTAILVAVGCCVAFLRNKNSHKETPSSDSSTCAEGKLEWNPVQEHKKVIIIYSLDHPLYKEIILKLCAFLRAKCGTDVTLDLLDTTWLSTIGKIQWLDTQRVRISKSLDKVLILCSPGVHAKWKAMCGEHKVRLKEDERSPIGDMLTPALSLIIPDFVHASSFHKYMVAYFDDVCREDDVPAPFNVVVKYKLMKHFEELYFRILDMEKHEPGRVKCIEGIRENDYFNCPSGRALRDAIEAFHSYQLKNPNWFEMELLDSDDDEEEENILESMFPINYNPVTECYKLTEERKAHAIVNLIKCHDLKSSIAETGILLNENSSVLTTDVYYSGSVPSSFTTLDVKGLPETKAVAQHALSLQPL